jgi:hypothetical protein
MWIDVNTTTSKQGLREIENDGFTSYVGIHDHVTVPALISNLCKVAHILCPDDACHCSGLLVVDEVLLPYLAPAGALAVEGANDTGVFVQVPYLENAV